MGKFISLSNLARFKAYLEIVFDRISEALEGKAEKDYVDEGLAEKQDDVSLSVVDGKLNITYEE